MNQLEPATFPLSGVRLIEASAGTGKTYTITSLYLRLLLGRFEPDGKPLGVDQILVLTFTVAATEELRARIRRRIRDTARAFASGETGDPFINSLIAGSTDMARDQKLLAAAQQLMDEAAIYTIHGYCARVLMDNAFETGMLFNQAMDADRDVLLEQAVQDCFRADLLTLPDIERNQALALWPTPARLLQKLKPFLFRQGITILPPATPNGGEHLRALIAEGKQRWIDEDFPAAIRAAGFRANAKVVTQLDTMTRLCASSELATELWSLWSSASLGALKLNKNGVYPEHNLLQLIDDICAAQDQLPFNLWHLVTDRVREYLAHYKRDLSQLTLDDLLTGVAEALASPTGSSLASKLATRWPVALIDEFQDTDDVQNEIFQQIYRNSAAIGLFLIGDPKQAIYQFRGADVFTYINAKRLVDPEQAVFSLATNWRSTVEMVAAVNHLFNQPNMFGNDRDIPFEQVTPSGAASGLSLRIKGQPVSPVTLMVDSSDAPGNQARLRQQAMAWAAEETVSLLHQGAAGQALIDGEPLHAGQIAFLVRDRTDARAARDALSARGVRSVYVTLDSVFLSDTADDLRLILQAALDPANEGAIRAALAVPLMLSTAEEIAATATDLILQQQVLAEFAEYHRLWAENDVATMLENLILKRGLATKWLQLPDGERQLTNLRHLAELLQSRAAVAPGMHRLQKWFTRERRGDENQSSPARQLRLESDSDLVQIVTMHAAKGLEYEIVMLPLPAFASRATANEPCLLHEDRDGHFTPLLELGNDPAHRARARAEQADEDLRLLYVAITRAKHKCYLGVPHTKTLTESALARLLQLAASDGDPLAALRRRLPGDLFDIQSYGASNLTPWQQATEFDTLKPPRTRPRPNRNWRVHSYTAVNRMIGVAGEPPGETQASVVRGFSDDETAAPAGTQTFAAAQVPNRFTFPRGPRAGIALHTLLEHLDFQTPPAAQLTLLDQCLDRTGITSDRDVWRPVLIDWLDDILAAELTPGVALQDIARTQRLDEMEFHFPLTADRTFIDVLKSAGYLESDLTLAGGVLQGLMTGLIDLVFEQNQRYYLVDYKSNHLGDRIDGYSRDAMQDAITHHRYDLQYLIYCVALNRYLRTRISDYQYAEHFGGVIYLFLRGMQSTGPQGIYTDLPDETLINRLDQALGGRA